MSRRNKLKVGMNCAVTYGGNGSEAKLVACKQAGRKYKRGAEEIPCPFSIQVCRRFSDSAA